MMPILKKDSLYCLNMYATNHDSRIWNEPNSFILQRFKDWDGSLFDFIPQRGGDPAKEYRCLGERITIEVMKAILSFLINEIGYEIPDQDLAAVRIPSLPESG
ncbi:MULTISPECIES: cytochrome P450 [unclassified Bacillus (in: firmicutes)]|uniref:cytochrome P450 n=1 Tax=unclassified Bacillus (in: firmicutes) TaxID=185979 RepID=UPI001BE7E967|nr:MULTISPECIES: cytochrome P450 [unclassified Bacillus (in: firmicutes)]MBT2640587.1 cytochrome P450 [Bacillus sp. ISL-39]MBT2663486.1 cytochrome P450 [Bacillus sp. ISL-45]